MLYSNANIGFWEKFNKVAPINVKLDEENNSGVELAMLPPIEFMSIIRPLFIDSLKVKHDQVKFAPGNNGYGPGKFRLKVKNIPIIDNLPTGQVDHTSSADGFELPKKRGVYDNGKVYLSGEMKSRFMEEYNKVVMNLENPIRIYLEEKYKNFEWDVLITYKPRVINGDKEIPSGNEWWIQSVEMDVIINLIQKIPTDKIEEIEKFYGKKELAEFDLTH